MISLVYSAYFAEEKKSVRERVDAFTAVADLLEMAVEMRHALYAMCKVAFFC